MHKKMLGLALSGIFLAIISGFAHQSEDTQSLFRAGGYVGSDMQANLLSFRMGALPHEISIEDSEIEVEAYPSSNAADAKDRPYDHQVYAAIASSLPAGTVQQGYLYIMNYADSSTCKVPGSGTFYLLNTCSPSTDGVYISNVAATDATTTTTLYYMQRQYSDPGCMKLSGTSPMQTVTNYGTCANGVITGLTATPSTLISNGFATRYTTFAFIFFLVHFLIHLLFIYFFLFY